MPEINFNNINVCFWNVNGRWSIIDVKFMDNFDIIFLSETHVNGSLLKHVDGYKIISDPSFASNNSGGMVAYVKLKLFPYITNIRFSKCTLSFSLSILPGFCFILVYMYPLDSMNYELNDFGIYSEEISYWLDYGFTPYIGGDFNSRLGNLNILSQRSLKWRYNNNFDDIVNGHGRLLSNVSELHNILPLNHCCYYDKVFDGKFTYHKAGKRSQIDFVFTNQGGRKFITDFKIRDTDWHLSDHLPLHLHLRLPFLISMDMICARAMELNSPFQPVQKIPSYKFNFNFNNAQRLFQDNAILLNEIFSSNSSDYIISKLDENIISILKKSKLKNENRIVSTSNKEFVDECDRLFDVYINKIQNMNNEVEINTAYHNYQAARDRLNSSTFKILEDKYRHIINHGDDRKLWNEINWSGKQNVILKQQIPMQVMSDYFERLYQPLDLNETNEMNNITSHVHIPINDDPITSEELQCAASKMKKGGYDFSLEVLKLILACISPLMLILFNLIFYVSYPIKFGISVLSTIPKKGNLKLLTNYRGIHMQNLMSLLYDRIIANRLIIWAKIHPEQTAFQKGKSTLNHIFLLRILIALAKHAKVPLFIGFFDLAKAFDKVSRPLLLKSLIKLGIGSVLLNAIKAMYSVTKCIIKSGKKLSDIFITHSGIKQGAPSSVILFIIFMNEFIDIVRQQCVHEQIIEVLHILLHADDTAVLSTNRSLFIRKCDVLLAAFKDKKVSLNLGKSGFLVINPQKPDDRQDIKLESGYLSYRSSYVYLGAIFSDGGVVAKDLDVHVSERQKSVFLKLSNFIRNNPAAPITVKKKILNSCLNASLLYGCETWSSASLRAVETLYRKAIKITFGMRNNTPNEIIFIESGLIELKCEVYKRQFKFWEKTMLTANNDYHTVTARIIIRAIEKNIQYIRHYKKLNNNFASANECFNFYKKSFEDKLKRSITDKTRVHSYSALDEYKLLNPNLKTPEMNIRTQCIINEMDRQTLTKYRSGSHMLKMATGYFQRIPIEERLCTCGELQTLEHVVLHCRTTALLRLNGSPDSLHSFFEDENSAVMKLRTMEVLLHVRRF